MTESPEEHLIHYPSSAVANRTDQVDREEILTRRDILEVRVFLRRWIFEVVVITAVLQTLIVYAMLLMFFTVS